MSMHILCAVDLNHPESEAALLRKAAELAGLYSATLSVVSVIPDYGMTMVGSYFKDGTMRQAVEDANTRLHEFVADTLPNAQAVQHILETGSVYDKILETAEREKIDLIIIGAHKPSITDGFQGPNSARIARKAPCSVLVVRA